jgi:hypothetical protein
MTHPVVQRRLPKLFRAILVPTHYPVYLYLSRINGGPGGPSLNLSYGAPVTA